MRDTIISHNLHVKKLQLTEIKEFNHGKPAST